MKSITLPACLHVHDKDEKFVSEGIEEVRRNFSGENNGRKIIVYDTRKNERTKILLRYQFRLD